MVILALVVALVAVGAVIYVSYRLVKVEKFLNNFSELKEKLEKTAGELEAQKIIEKFERIEKRINSNAQVFGRLTGIGQRLVNDIGELSNVFRNLSLESSVEEISKTEKPKGSEEKK